MLIAAKPLVDLPGKVIEPILDLLQQHLLRPISAGVQQAKRLEVKHKVLGLHFSVGVCTAVVVNGKVTRHDQPHLPNPWEFEQSTQQATAGIGPVHRSPGTLGERQEISDQSHPSLVGLEGLVLMAKRVVSLTNQFFEIHTNLSMLERWLPSEKTTQFSWMEGSTELHQVGLSQTLC